MALTLAVEFLLMGAAGPDTDLRRTVTSASFCQHSCSRILRFCPSV